MYDEILSLQAHERIDEMIREARAHQLVIDATSLRFRKESPLVRARRLLAAGLIRLGYAIAPHSDHAESL